MTNGNCLEDIACPKCSNDSMIYIEVKTLAVVTDDGAETYGDMEWDGNSYAECPECEYRGTLAEFRINESNDESNNSKEQQP